MKGKYQRRQKWKISESNKCKSLDWSTLPEPNRIQIVCHTQTFHSESAENQSKKKIFNTVREKYRDYT